VRVRVFQNAQSLSVHIYSVEYNLHFFLRLRFKLGLRGAA
jgi:hypothetical protein